jgi:hypothetical protein
VRRDLHRQAVGRHRPVGAEITTLIVSLLTGGVLPSGSRRLFFARPAGG